jgi:hypothetical protein
VARRLGLSSGYSTHLARLEQGRLKFPTLALVLDYLRACHASVAELAPLLDRYTRMPAVPVAATEPFSATATVADAPSPEQSRAELRLRKRAQIWLEHGRLDQTLNQQMDNLGVLALVPVRMFVFDYGHKVWRILKSTRQGSGWRARTREPRLLSTEQQALSRDVVPLDGLRLVARVTTELFGQMEADGVFDRLLSLDEACGITKSLSAKFRKTKARVEVVRSRLPYRPELLPAIRADADRLIEQDCPERIRARSYRFWLGQLEQVALATAAGSEERAARIEELINATKEPALSRRIAQVYLDSFERWRPRLLRETPGA